MEWPAADGERCSSDWAAGSRPLAVYALGSITRSSGLGLPIPGWAMLPVPLLPQAEGVKPLGTIHREYAVEVIDLVLEKLCTVSLHFYLLPLPFEVLISHSDPVSPRYTDQEVRERKAIIPDLEVLCPDVDDLRIDQWPRPIHLDVYHSNRGANLRRGDSATAAKTRLPVPESFPEVVQNDSDPRRLRLGDRLTPGAEDGVTKKSDSMNRHRCSRFRGSTSLMTICGIVNNWASSPSSLRDYYQQ